MPDQGESEPHLSCRYITGLSIS